MKIRIGFVSNSSSTSFTCQVYGSTESGMDMSMSDAGMVKCENGHTICESHILNDTLFTLQEKKQMIIEREYTDKKERLWLQNLQDDELLEYFESGYGYDWWRDYESDMRHGNYPAKSCPICQFKSGRDKDFADFALSELGWTREFALKTMEKTYKIYTDFRKAMK